MQLAEGNGIAALAEPNMDIPRVARFNNTTTTLDTHGLATTADELSWIGDTRVAARPMNPTIMMMWMTEEAEILSHPDVAAAVEAALPDLEDWEHTL